MKPLPSLRDYIEALLAMGEGNLLNSPNWIGKIVFALTRSSPASIASIG
jgi:hypothetical protein